jgi:RNA polymerase sigma factor (sigma-70 family)
VLPVDASDLPALVRASADGDEKAWSELVRRYAHLVVKVTRQYRLSQWDAQDVGQTVWLRLVEHLPTLRIPAALPKWILMTTQHECQRQVRMRSRTVPVDTSDDRGFADTRAPELDVDLIEAERHQALRDGLAELPNDQREFLLLFAADPPHTYAEIKELLGMPIGSIGPTRQRALEKLRQTNAIRNYLAATSAAENGGGPHALAGLE